MFLYSEPNCCPGNGGSLQFTRSGSATVQTSSAVDPTYNGAPPPHCVP